MFSRILVATDLSPASISLIDCVAFLKLFGSRECLLLQCLNMHDVNAPVFEHSRSVLEPILNDQIERMRKHGLMTSGRIIPGSAKTEINRIAVDENYSLIVIGSRGHSLAGAMLLGSVASSVIQNARKPVLLLRLEVKDGVDVQCLPTCQCDFREHILFPTDFSDNAKQALVYVEKLVRDGAKRVTLFHVQDKTRIDPHLRDRIEEFNEIDRSRLQIIKENLQSRADVIVDIELAYGSPFREIMRMIIGKKISLVVMGSQGRGYIEEIFLGSVSHNVARHSVVPVLLVPAQR